jgi:hypothetical protein
MFGGGNGISADAKIAILTARIPTVRESLHG